MISKKAYLLQRYDYVENIVRKGLKQQEINNAVEARKLRLKQLRIDTAKPKC